MLIIYASVFIAALALLTFFWALPKATFEFYYKNSDNSDVLHPFAFAVVTAEYNYIFEK